MIRHPRRFPWQKFVDDLRRTDGLEISRPCHLAALWQLRTFAKQGRTIRNCSRPWRFRPRSAAARLDAKAVRRLVGGQGWALGDAQQRGGFAYGPSAPRSQKDQPRTMGRISVRAAALRNVRRKHGTLR